MEKNDATIDEKESLRERLSLKLAPFFKQNPTSRLSRIERDGKSTAIIGAPWGDESLYLLILNEGHSIIDVLNHVHLPNRFCGVWHTDTKDLEFLLASTPVPDTELKARNFKFQYKGESLTCEFAPVSDRALSIVASSRGVKGKRNDRATVIESLWLYRRTVRERQDSTDITAPLAFWIRNLQWEENYVSDLIRNLNFYMYYFDRETLLLPEIWVETKNDDLTWTRYPTGSFPTSLVARPLDQNLLDFWHSSIQSTSPRLTFIHAYQALEYCAFYSIKDDTLQGIKKIVMAPDVQFRSGEVAKSILDLLVNDRMSDEDRIRYIVQRYVNVEKLWNEMQGILKAFTSDVQFDGGFEIKAVFKPESEFSDFKANWTKLPNELIRIRNALVHGRESRTSSIISPSKRNDAALLPWLTPLRFIAMELILYTDSHSG